VSLGGRDALRDTATLEIVSLPLNVNEAYALREIETLEIVSQQLIINHARRSPRSTNVKHMPQGTQAQSDTSTQARNFNLARHQMAEDRLQDAPIAVIIDFNMTVEAHDHIEFGNRSIRFRHAHT
jgi:hypothetical protein